MDPFIASVAFWAVIMGLDVPTVVDRKDLPGLRVAQVSCDAFGGCIIERHKAALNYRLWNKQLLALHEMCHVRYATSGHEQHERCVREYWKRRRKLPTPPCLLSAPVATRTDAPAYPRGFYVDTLCTVKKGRMK